MCRIERCTQWLHSVHSCCAWCSDVVKILPFLLVFAHLCKICRVHAALSWVSMIRSGFGAHLNVQNRKMYAMVTLCTFLLRLVLWRCQNTAHLYWCLHTFVKYVECMQHFHELVWLDRKFGEHLYVQNRKMYAMVTLCTFLLRLVLWRCQNTAHFYWCLHTFVKYVECMQHFYE